MIRSSRRPSIARVTMAALLSAGLVLPYPIAATATPGAGLGSVPAGPSLVTEVAKKKKNVYVKKNYTVKKNVYVARPVRVWKRKPYYGNILAGVALGTVLGVALAGTAPVAPGPNLCWYWTNPAMTHGYWDYCY